MQNEAEWLGLPGEGHPLMQFSVDRGSGTVRH